MRITSVRLQNYRAFRDITLTLEPLTVLVGANGTGKSSIFEFLRFLRDAVQSEIPPPLLKGTTGRSLYRQAAIPEFGWTLTLDHTLRYTGRLRETADSLQIVSEQAEQSGSVPDENEWLLELDASTAQGRFFEPGSKPLEQRVARGKANQLILMQAVNPHLPTLYNLRTYMLGWRFYSGFTVRIGNRIRIPARIEQHPVLDENGGNLSAVLHFLMTEHRRIFDELERLLGQVVPGFEYLTVKARGGPGEVLGFWKEAGVEQELSLADLSDGTLRLLCWLTLAIQPDPPTLIAIDEPDQGLHPRALGLLAGLFQKAASRTQLLFATHNSYFLSRFEIAQIGVLRKEQGTLEFINPGESQTLLAMLADFGSDEIEQLHRSDELERLP